MGTKNIKKIKGEEFEILDHTEVPGFKTAFHIIFCVAVVYFIYIFFHAIH